MSRYPSASTERARSLRKRQTTSEGLLWHVIRGRQICGLKFRRQYPIGPFIADFACRERLLVVELDGDYHEHVAIEDLDREAFLRQRGWDVIRFTNDEVAQDAEVVATAIAKHLGMDYAFLPRRRSGSGMEKRC